MKASLSILTAVVISYNSASDLPGCLAGLAQAGLPMLVVDNGSREGSVRIAREHRQQAVEVLGLGTTTGFAGGSNRGFASVPAEVSYQAVMNHYVEVQPGCLKRNVSVHKEQREGGLAVHLDAEPRLALPAAEFALQVGLVARYPLHCRHDTKSAQLWEMKEVVASRASLGLKRTRGNHRADLGLAGSARCHAGRRFDAGGESA